MRLDYQRGEYAKTLHIYCSDPSNVTNMDRLRVLDEMTTRETERLQNEINALQAYHLNLIDHEE